MFLKTKYGLGYIPRFFPFPQTGKTSNAVNELLASVDAMWLPDKANGLIAGINAPVTSPMKDLKGTANLNLVNFDGIVVDLYDTGKIYDTGFVYGEDLPQYPCADGYTLLTPPSGINRVSIKSDGVNSYLTGSNPILDFTGTSDFGIGKLIKTSSLITQYIISNSEQSEATTQYALKITNTGILSIIIEGTNIQLQTGLTADTIYGVWVERISGVLKCYINGVEVFSVANVVSLTSRPNFRLGAMSSNVGGTTQTGFTNTYYGCGVIVRNNVQNGRLAWDKFIKSYFGIGL